MPSAFFMVLMLIYPVYKILGLLHVNSSLSHTLPKIERNCKLSFIRENMLLAVILDSFCITNYVHFYKWNIVFPRVMGMVTLFLQDIPQITIHVIFLVFYHHHEVDHGYFTVKFSLYSSLIAIFVSIFNVFFSEPNEFDTILLKNEMEKRMKRYYEKMGITEEE